MSCSTLNIALPESADEAAGGEGLLDEEGLGRSAAVQEAPVVHVPLQRCNSIDILGKF